MCLGVDGGQFWGGCSWGRCGFLSKGGHGQVHSMSGMRLYCGERGRKHEERRGNDAKDQGVGVYVVPMGWAACWCLKCSMPCLD